VPKVNADNELDIPSESTKDNGEKLNLKGLHEAVSKICRQRQEHVRENVRCGKATPNQY